ncbi:MAG: DUF512 domain-containing protein [Acetatifactor sp.]|nr:DUF512 domain-containing protein [Acetatifactor sp.]
MTGDKNIKGHLVSKILPGSIAEEMEIEPGDRLLSINDTEIEDIFDYQYLVQDSDIDVCIQKPDGEEWVLEIEKDPDEDLGIVFESGLMDEYRHCSNKCIFCFIDQMPKGMRETLYFKDDDSRLSFLQGNYVTLTNMSDKDVERICKYHLSPINISIQTMNPELRCMMLHNRFAGTALKKIDRLCEAGIVMNGQIVLCKGVNDGKELEYSIEKLMEYMPHFQSVSVVPVGLSKYREGLYPLEPFTKEDAVKVLETIHKYQKICYEKYENHFVHASDEWYILAEAKLPDEDNYDGYNQLENGVGMIRLLLNEFEDAKNIRLSNKMIPSADVRGEISMATGLLAYPFIKKMSDEIMSFYPNIEIHVYGIVNEFFGEKITVSGLLTGGDLMKQLQGKKLGERLILPENVLRSGEDVFLDDYHVSDLEKTLQVKVNIVKSTGYDFWNIVDGKEV